MAVSKRVRFEVLKRDNYTCRYCRSAENELTVDHVTPVALGGRDQPKNLVAACRDCNAGKSSTAPDAAPIADLTEAEIAYERVRAAVLERNLQERKRRYKALKTIEAHWDDMIDVPALPAGWVNSVDMWLARGLGVDQVCDAINIVSGKYLPDKAIFPYVAKICWNWISDLEEQIEAELKTVEVEDESAFDPTRIVDLFVDKMTKLLPSSVKLPPEVS